MASLIYLDHHATTPCDPRVVEVMLPYFGQYFGNAGSPHEAGRHAAEAVDVAREEVAALIGAQAGEIIFTAGATESNNLALLGRARRAPAERRRIVTTAIEHKAVLQPCRELEKSGFELVVLPVQCDGTVDLEAARDALNESVLFVSVQAASGEIGTIQPVREIADLAHHCGALVHCDAAQAAGKIPLDVLAWDVDFLSLSAHKLYGPKGVGALWVRSGRRSKLAPLQVGGGQERELRPGTLNVPGIVGMGEACRLCREEMPDETARLAALRDELESYLSESIPNLRINGSLENRLPHNSSLAFSGIEADALLAHLPDVALSTGSACDSGALEPSKVLQAIGLSREDATSTLRVGLGRTTTSRGIQIAARRMVEAIERIQSLMEATA